jgi:multidrug resistance efflux pump
MKRIRRYQSGRLGPHVLPVLVWLVAVGGVVMMFHHRSQRFEILGMAQGQVRQIAATCTGRLRSVPVQLFQEVRTGDTLAVIDTVLDNEHLEAQLATATAEIQRLKAELVRTQEQLLAEASNQQTNWIADRRRFSVDVENTRLRILGLKTELETDRTMLENLELNSKIFIAQNISDQNDVTYYELQKTKIEYNALAKKVEENQRLLVQAESDLEQAQQRCDEFAQYQLQPLPVDGALEVIRRAVKVQELLVGELLARRVPLVLKSPIDGVVSQILRRPVRRTGEGVVRQMLRRSGEAIVAGETILTVSATESSEIIAYASGEQISRVTEGMVVKLVKENEPAQIASSRVTYLGPIMEVMPQRLWTVPDIPQWGRPMLIEIPPGLKLIPGEVVGIKGL